MAKNRKFRLTPVEDGHYFVSSIATWRTGNDVEKLIRQMRADGFPFVLIWVPLPASAKYRIEGYVPVVDGCIKLAEYLIED